MSATFHAVGKGEQTTSAASFTITCTISAGDFLVVVASWDSASTTTPTVVTTGGTGSDSGTLILGPITAASFGAKYGAWLVSSAGSGRTGVTVSWASSNPTFADGYCWSASGLTTPTLDKSPHTDGSSTNPSSGSTGTLATTDQFAVSYAASASTTVGATGGGFTDDGNTPSTGSKGGHQVVTANTALTGSFTAATSAWLALALTIKAGAAAGSPVIPYDASDGPHSARRFAPDASKATNLNLFKNPIPFGPYDYGDGPFRVHQTQIDLSRATNLNLFKNPIPFSNIQGITTGWGVADLPAWQQPYNASLYTVTVSVTLMGQIWL